MQIETFAALKRLLFIGSLCNTESSYALIILSKTQSRTARMKSTNDFFSALLILKCRVPDFASKYAKTLINLK